MRTAEDCRRQVTKMNMLAAKSPVLREQYLQMAQLWERLGRESAQAEGIEDEQPPRLSEPSGPLAAGASGDDAEIP
jgi:NAD-dependent oxidoreductase involved in siderophore biosynthesis